MTNGRWRSTSTRRHGALEQAALSHEERPDAATWPSGRDHDQRQLDDARRTRSLVRGPGLGWSSLLDEVPLTSSADFVQQNSIVDSNADHVPFTFTDPAWSSTARAARAYTTYGATAAGTNHIGVRVRRPGDTLAGSPVVFSGNAELAALTTKAGIIPPPTGGWTRSALANTDLLVGFSTDVSPAPRVHGALLEVDYRG